MHAELRPQPRPFADPPGHGSILRQRITAATRIPEAEALAPLLEAARLPTGQLRDIDALATRLVTALRAAPEQGGAGRAQLVQGLLQEYALSSQEGVALMCLAEALLRIPDDATRDALIRDKIAHGRWQAHLGHSPSLFVNAATWGLLLTGRLVATHSETRLSGGLSRLIAKGGEPLIRRGVDLAMRTMGEHFVTGRTIDEALARSRPREAQGFRYSFDMLGEAALTAEDAARYRADYENAIHAIGRAGAGRGFIDGPGISIKLSALHPRYTRSQQGRVFSELQPILGQLAALACGYDIGLNIDAEEADRLELSLDLLEDLCFEPALAGWNGLGFVVQAYQKRCPAVIDHLIDLARRSGRRLMVRLVKGAYWDSEIKRAQVDGLEDYPVFTRKVHTDVAYVACARRLLAAPDAIYPQFATHNARTLATLYELADPARWTPDQYEFQCLHGMGEPLYEQVVGTRADGGTGRPCRIYAPVGTHETLLAYLVRRLLENGANTSFVNRVADPGVPIAELVRDPVAIVDAATRDSGTAGLPHPAIPLPHALYGPGRRNARGLDLADERGLQCFAQALQAGAAGLLTAAPTLGGVTSSTTSPAPAGHVEIDAHGDGDGDAVAVAVVDPSDRRELIGTVREADRADVARALDSAVRAAPDWAAVAPAERAATLCRAADAIEAALPRLAALLVREAGKTAGNAVAEVREAVDFLRYYAAEVEADFDNATHLPLGPVACISPWNFPLAIFLGQISAALAAGNVVLAKPAEQTPLIAAEAVNLLHAAGVPSAALQLLPGRGEIVGAALVADPRIRAVLFTGSTAVARLLQQTLAARDAGRRPTPLIAETGGQNAMIVDSSALPEQVVTDVIASAFDSAGQRCSALRVLCVQQEAYPRIRALLVGAMAELQVGRPDRLATDVGPVIDESARTSIEQYIRSMRGRGFVITQAAGRTASALGEGSFVPPTLVEIKAINDLGAEVFGPVLHLLAYRRDQLDTLLAALAATGYGLTMGLHTRIDETIARVADRAAVGNLYVNRNMVGAVVGVQPFGGEGLSGTGPKAGGPLYLYRLLAQRPDAAPMGALTRQARTVPAANPSSLPVASPVATPIATPGTTTTATEATTATSTGGRTLLQRLAAWADQAGQGTVVALCHALAAIVPPAAASSGIDLPGPTGEHNSYRVRARSAILCLTRSEPALLRQLAAILAVDGHALWPRSAAALLDTLPNELRARVSLAPSDDPFASDFGLVLHEGPADDLSHLRARLARRPGAVIPVVLAGEAGLLPPLEQLLVERVLSVNTAAAGGNASLMTLG